MDQEAMNQIKGQSKANKTAAGNVVWRLAVCGVKALRLRTSAHSIRCAHNSAHTRPVDGREQRCGRPVPLQDNRFAAHVRYTSSALSSMKPDSHSAGIEAYR